MDSTENSDVTQETGLSSDKEDSDDPDYDLRASPLQRVETVYDLRDQLLREQKLHDLVIRQERRLRAAVLHNVERVRDTLSRDPYKLHQARDYVDDLII